MHESLFNIGLVLAYCYDLYVIVAMYYRFMGQK